MMPVEKTSSLATFSFKAGFKSRINKVSFIDILQCISDFQVVKWERTLRYFLQPGSRRYTLQNKRNSIEEKHRGEQDRGADQNTFWVMGPGGGLRI